jgi:putative transposase
MPRSARIVIPGCPHHVTQRGNNRQDVFFTADDYAFYLELVKEQSEKFGLRVDGYCLMTNHVHLVCTPRHEESLAKAIGRANLYYTRYINDRHGRCGHLWQDRFFSSPLDESYYWNALIYVERNPVRAGLVRKAWRYRWSSAAAHVGEPDASGLLNLARWSKSLPRDGDWSEAISGAQDEQVVNRLRSWSNRGCPLGSDRFIAKMESALGRRLRPGKRGRPQKKKPAITKENGNRPE